jgi:hypothetical protein
VDAGSECKPLGHLMQPAALGAEYVLTGQGEHADDPAGDHQPGEHGKQAEAIESANVPAEHLVHTDDPKSE